MTESYIGVFQDRKMINKTTLNDISNIPYVEYIFKRELHHEFKTPSGYVCKYFSFTPINNDGTKRILKAGNFEIIDIGPDEGERNFKGRTIRISENNGQKIYEHRSLNQYDFILEELLPLIDILIKTGSWDIFCKLERLKKAEQEIQDFKEKLNIKDQEIIKLKNEIENLKSASK